MQFVLVTTKRLRTCDHFRSRKSDKTVVVVIDISVVDHDGAAMTMIKRCDISKATRTCTNKVSRV